MPEGASPAVPGSDEVRRMMPGPDMDLLVHRLVLGRPWWADTPPYSADIAAAWEVVLKFGPGVRLTWHALCPETGQSFVWAAALWAGGEEVVGYGSTAPIALSRAALLAAGAAQR